MNKAQREQNNKELEERLTTQLGEKNKNVFMDALEEWTKKLNFVHIVIGVVIALFLAGAGTGQIAYTVQNTNKVLKEQDERHIFWYQQVEAHYRKIDDRLVEQEKTISTLVERINWVMDTYNRQRGIVK